MRKFLMFISSTFVLTVAPANIIACGQPATSEAELKIPDWVQNMSSSKTAGVGYDHYWLPNRKDHPWDQRSWANISLNNNFYLYLPQANSIDEAINKVIINDSAHMRLTTGIFEPVTWKKVNDTTYTNNQFITQDTVIDSKAVMDQTKFNEIKNSSKLLGWKDKKDKDFFNDYGSVSRTKILQYGTDWWNSNQWEGLLSDEKNLTSTKDPDKKFSEKDIYNEWVGNKNIGMNVPLSLVAPNSFTLRQTKLDHIFSLQITPKEVWRSNKGGLMTFSLPHWGFSFSFKEQIKGEEKIFQTPQTVGLQNAFKQKDMEDYLENKAHYYSFNSEKKIFKSWYIPSTKPESILFNS